MNHDNYSRPPAADDAPPSFLRPSQRDTLLSVVLPVYNEVKVLWTLLSRVQQSLDARSVRREIIFVDDGSTDGSSGVLDQIAARFPEVRIIHFSRNFGHRAAV